MGVCQNCEFFIFFFFCENIQTLESAWWALMKILKCESVKELSMSVKCK